MVRSSGATAAEPLLAWNRGHWMVENANHYRRDASLGEDTSCLRTRHAPANNATLNNIALAIVLHRGFPPTLRIPASPESGPNGPNVHIWTS